MAVYTPRSDGLVDLHVAPGLALPMSEQQAQQGGNTPGPAPEPSPFPATNPNPFSMIKSGKATAGLAEATAAAMKHSRDGQPTAPGTLFAPPPSVPDWATGKTFDSEAAANQVKAEKAAERAAADAEAEKAKLRAITPPEREGGYQLDQPVKVSGGGLQLAQRVVRPGVKGEPSFKRVMSELSPEEVAKQHEAGAEGVYLERDQALESERLANEQQALDNQDRKDQIAVRRGILQEKLNTIEQREREAANATPQSRDQILGSRSTLARVLSGLSIAMGARYQGLTGRNNPGLDLLNQSLADEIAGQRMKYEAAKDKVAMANTDFGKAMQLYGDPNVAEAELYSRGLTLAANIAQNHWKRAENLGDYAKQKEIAQTLKEQAAEKKQQAFTLLNGQVLQDTYQREAPRVEGVLTEDQRERQVHVPGYGYGFVANKAAATAVQDQMTAAGNALDIFAELRALQKDGRFVNDLNTRKALKALKARALPAISAAEKQGVVTEADAKNAKDVLNDENAIFSDGVAALDATELAIRLQLDGIVRDRIYQDPYARVPMQRQRAGSFKPGL